MRIFVTAIGSFAADIVIKTLHANHHQVIGSDMYPGAWIAEAGNVDTFVQAPCSRDKEEYISFLKSSCCRYDVQYIIPLTDPEADIISEIKDELAQIGVYACVADFEVVMLCRDKFKLPHFLAEKQVCPTIPTLRFNDITSADWGFPMLAKPRLGRSSEGVIRIACQANYGYVKEMVKGCDYVIQPLIKGSIITVDVIRNLDDQVICIARRELLRNPSGAGITVEIIEDRQLTETCTRIARALRVIGAMNFEFIEAVDQVYFLEANPRFSGGVEFSHMAGYDVVTNHLRCFSGSLIDTEVEIRKMIIARKYEEYITAVL